MEKMSTLQEIEFGDRNIFEAAYSSLKAPLADQSFSMIYIWKRQLSLQWAKINNNLCIFGNFLGKRVLWGPVIGGGKLKETLDECFSILDKANQKGGSRLCYLPEELAEGYRRLNGYKVIPQSQEYVYNIPELVALKGGKYRNKRNSINKLLSNYKPSVEDYKPVHKKECLGLLERWKSQKEELIGENAEEQFRAELKIAEATIRLADALKLKGMVVFIDGKIQAMTFGDALTRNMCSVIVEKTNLRISGLSEFTFTEFLKRHWNGFEWANAQEDMGVPYLMEAKMRYHPAFLIKSFSVVRS